MKKYLIIFFLVILSLKIVSSNTLKIEYPSRISPGIPFNLKIKLINFSKGDYNLKIDILDNKKRISKVFFNKKWKSTYYYLNGLLKIPDKNNTILKLKISKTDSKNLSIHIKIKKQNKVILTGICFVDLGFFNKTLKKCNLKTKENLKIKEFTENSSSTIYFKNKETKDIKTKEYLVYESKTEKIKKYSLFLFGIWCVMISIIIIYKQLYNGPKNKSNVYI